MILGFTFKENCPDIRNTGVVKIIERFQKFKIDVKVFDPWANTAKAYEEYGISLLRELTPHKYDAIVLAVSHNEFKKLKLENYSNAKTIIYDVKGVLSTFTNRL